jgi:DDE family transposase
MYLIEGISNIIKRVCNYKAINKYSKKKLRNKIDGISLMDAIYYRFQYVNKPSTKQDIVSSLNNTNDTNISRQGYDSKESNIPTQMYINLLNEIIDYYNMSTNTIIENNIIAIDGTYNINNNYELMLNIGVFDISNNIPINIKLIGADNQNKEVQASTNYIKENIDKFKNSIIVADRLYYNFDFIYFLESNNLKYIIRAKCQADTLNKDIELKKNIQKREIINIIRKNVRVIKNTFISTKTINSSNSKEKNKEMIIESKNDYVIITNLEEDKYSNEKLSNIYKSRWDIEVYFKLLKENFKFRNLKEKEKAEYEKIYLCELILTYIIKIIEYDYSKNNKDYNIDENINITINKSNLIKGIFKSFLYDILNDLLDTKKISRFYKSYVLLVKNKKGRSFPRRSKLPFTKWYVKYYSETTKYKRIKKALDANNIDELNKNLKTIAKNIISINDKKYG